MIDGLAVYAAVVATAGIGWQAYTWRQDRAVMVTVEVGYGITSEGSADLVLVTLTNSSRFDVRWTQAGIDLQDGSKQFAMIGLGDKVARGFELPKVVKPRDSSETAIEAPTLKEWGVDLYRPLVAQARLGTGQVFKSRPKTLLSK
jgi:hypothetical protein